MSSCTPIRSRADMAAMLERFFELAPAEGHATGWDWDDFENAPFKEPDLESWRQHVLNQVGHLVAPSRGVETDKIADERIASIIASLRRNEDAPNQ